MSLNEAVQKAHADAVTEAKKKMPEIELSDLIKFAIAVAENKKTPEEAVKELTKKYRLPAEVYVKVFVKIASQEGIKLLLAQTKIEQVRTMAETDFSENMVKASTQAAMLAQKYYTGKIDGAKFIEEMFDSGITEVGKQYADAVGIPTIDPQVIYRAITDTSILTMSYACAAEAYNILMKAMDDASIQHEKTLQIQVECEKYVAMIQQYRKEMEDVVAQYLSSHITSFEKGFNEIDQAILANDVDGYLKGNANIQRALGYKVQFETKNEFDDLMASDIPFKL